VSGSKKEHAWIVLTGGLLILFKWALTLLKLRSSWCGLKKVWLPCREWHIAGAIEETRSSKATKEGIVVRSGTFWEVKEANFGEWFCCAHVSSGTPLLSGCVHCCCCLLLLLWAATKNGSLLCSEYLFIPITTHNCDWRNFWEELKVCSLPSPFQVVYNYFHSWSCREREREKERKCSFLNQIYASMATP